MLTETLPSPDLQFTYPITGPISLEIPTPFSANIYEVRFCL